jgi:hypothetical protein
MHHCETELAISLYIPAYVIGQPVVIFLWRDSQLTTTGLVTHLALKTKHWALPVDDRQLGSWIIFKSDGRAQSRIRTNATHPVTNLPNASTPFGTLEIEQLRASRSRLGTAHNSFI